MDRTGTCMSGVGHGAIPAFVNAASATVRATVATICNVIGDKDEAVGRAKLAPCLASCQGRSASSAAVIHNESRLCGPGWLLEDYMYRPQATEHGNRMLKLAQKRATSGPLPAAG